MRRLFWFLWRLLPDRCQDPGCARLGIRGNENIVDGKILCDYCAARHVLFEIHHEVGLGQEGFRWARELLQ
jgi:hypothetical protein